MKGKNLTVLAGLLGSSLDNNGIMAGFTIDSRAVNPNDVFFALKGEKVDAHTCLEEVASKKALAAVVAQDYKGESFGLPLIRVESVIQALQTLAAEAMSHRKARVVAVTGSVGKTTTKEFIAKILEGKFRVEKSPGNANSQVGLPLTILNSDGHEEILVLEMGMNLPGEIKTLTEIAPPDIAVITRVALAHSAFFNEGVKGIAAAKAEILSHPKTTLGIINAQCMQFDSVVNAGSCRKVFYSLEPTAHADYLLRNDNGQIQIEIKGDKSPLFTLPFQASHLIENFLAAAAVGKELGMHWEQIIKQAQLLTTYKRRFERVEREGVVFINDSYNANPESMRAALMNLPLAGQGKKRIAVLGEMKELGKFSEESHREIGKLALGCVDHLLCFGTECLPMVKVFQDLGRKGEIFSDFNEMKERLFTLTEPGDVVLIKGSNSKKMWRILEEDESH